MAEQHLGEGCRTTTICIDSYENGVPGGRIFHPQLGGQTFFGAIPMLTAMEHLLEQTKQPRSYTQMRRFDFAAAYETGPPAQQVPTGRKATFAVKILFRQNASWQGSVLWLEGRQEQSFRSVLELLLLVDSALQAKEAVS